MVRLFSALLAMLIAATGVWLSVRGVEALLPIIVVHAHSGRFAPAVHLFPIFFPVAVVLVFGLKERRAKRDEDVPLRPMVRRLPSGLREL
jgi:hypothetical protein